MSFDGIPRAPYSDPLGSQLAAYEAQKLKKKPSISSVKDSDGINAVHKENRQHHDAEDDDDKQEGLTEEEQEQILIFAKLRGLLNFSLKEGVVYRFQLNEDTQLIELVEASTGRVMLTLTPDELTSVFTKIERYAGLMTDHSA